MGAVKELYFAEMERKFQELLDQGVPEDEACERAGNQAYDEIGDRMADLADRARQRAKDAR